MTPPVAPQGTWTARPAPTSNYEWDLIDPDGVTVAWILAVGPGKEPLPVEATARQIAVALNAYSPLVEALGKIAEQFCDSDDCFASADARTALALARGEQP